MKPTALPDRIVLRARAQPRGTATERRPGFVLDAFRIHERVGGGSDTDDQIGDACQVEWMYLPSNTRIA
jgi:hypothetical protein